MTNTEQFIGFKSILEVINYFDSEQKCSDYLAYQRWGDTPVCPYCENDKIYILKGKNKRYKCSSCRKQFSVRVGTIFEDSKISLKKWFVAIWLVTSHKKGISSLQLSKDIDVTQKTAWFILQRIRYALSYDFTDTLDNEVEIDETFIGGKNKNRHSNKKVENSQGRSVKDKTPVLGMIERDGALVAKVVKDTQGATLTPEIVNIVKDTAKIYTDEWLGYKGLKRIFDHAFIKHNESEYVRGRIHTYTIEGFWSILKRGIVGIYHFTSKKHLQKYVDEFVFRYNTRNMSESFRFQFYLSNCNRYLSYKKLLGKFS